jgi:hypothetical protein
MEYSALEWMVSAFIWKLVSPDQRLGQTITASLGFRQRATLLGALFSMLEPYGMAADEPGLRGVLKQAETAVAKRNDIVHALAWVPDNAGELTHMKLQPGKAAKWTGSPAGVHDLTALRDELKAARTAVEQFMLKHFEPYGPAAWASPLGHGTLFGAAAAGAIAWARLFGTGGASAPPTAEQE